MLKVLEREVVSAMGAMDAGMGLMDVERKKEP